MNKESFTCSGTIASNATLDVIELTSDLFAFKTKVTYTNLKFNGTFVLPNAKLPSAYSRQGFVNATNLNKLKSGKSFKTLNLCIMPTEIQEALRLKGWNAWDDKKLESWEPNNEFDLVNDPNFSLNLVVEVKHEGHMLADYTGRVLPVGILFNYIDGGITDGRYNLKVLAEHLLTRSDVKIYSRDGFAASAREAITSIPSYSSERGCRETISFIWQPCSADYIRMWEWCVSNEKRYPSTVKHQAVFELDLLGSRAAGANRYDTYYASKRYEGTR